MSAALLYWSIIGCEAAFWLVLVVALCVRFLLLAAPSLYPRTGWPAVHYEMKLWVRCLVAWAIALFQRRAA